MGWERIETPEAERIEQELRLAVRFRAEGNYGRARVCARRAAGWAVGPIYRLSTGDRPPANALTLLRWYRDHDRAPLPLRQAAGRLTTHVTRSHDLPYPEDPVEDAEMLVQALTMAGHEDSSG